MFNKLTQTPCHRSTTLQSLARRLFCEPLEDRRMLAGTQADIVFLVDESFSDTEASTQEWLSRMVAGVDANNNGDRTEMGDVLNLADQLATQGIDDVRYGLVGFGQRLNATTQRYAHSQLLEPGITTSLFGTPAVSPTPDSPATLSTAELNTVFNTNTAEDGGLEDGWDAIEHAIAEYDFRDGAVAIFVLVQNDEGRAPLDASFWTRDGVLSALESKNVILNTLTAGNNFLITSTPETDDAEGNWQPIFDLSPYNDLANPSDNFSPDIRILGVEADAADNVADGQHDFHWVDTDTINMTADVPTPTTSDALQISYNGSGTGETGMVGTSKSVLIAQGINGSIGTTAAGYSAKNVAFAYEELQSPNTFSGAIPFNFTFYGNSETQVWADEDGLLRFSSTDVSGDNADLSQQITTNPNVNPDPSRYLTIPPIRPNQAVIAPLWDDLAAGTSGQLRYEQRDVDFDGQSDLIVEWQDFHYAADALSNDLNNLSPDPITFQAVLYATGDIRFNYKMLESFSSFGLNANNVDGTLFDDTGGIGATVGIWSGAADKVIHDVGKFVPGLHRISGANVFNYGETTSGDRLLVEEIDSNDSYIRMAWDTGGAAWDVGIVDEYVTIDSDEANALRDALVGSLADQILRAEAVDRVFHEDTVLRAINLGGPALPAEGFEADPDPLTPSNTLTTPGSTAIDTQSNSIPEVGNPAVKVEEVFRSARTVNDGNFLAETLSLSIDTLAGGAPLLNGAYVVELFFAELENSPGNDRDFDVLLEGITVLNDYAISDDRAKIDTSFSSSSIEHDSTEAGLNTGIVKRFEVQVADGALSIDLIPERRIDDPILNGIRILAGPTGPRVAGVTASSSFYPQFGAFDFDTVDGTEDQLKRVPLGSIDRIAVRFDRPIDAATMSTSNFQLTGLRTGADPSFTVSYDAVTWTALLTLDEPLAVEQYALTVRDGVTDASGYPLDGEWVNPARQQYGWFGFDPETRTYFAPSSFPSGNHESGGDFAFVFTILPESDNAEPNGILTSQDLNHFDTNYGAGSVAVASAIDTLFDFDRDGVIDSSDRSVYSALVNEGWDLRVLVAAADFDYDASPTSSEGMLVIIAVDQDDLNVLLDNWLQSVPAGEDGDANGDGFVDLGDVFVLSNQIGLEIVVIWNWPGGVY